MKKIIAVLSIATGLLSISCVNHRYIVLDSKKPRKSETIYFKAFFLAGWVSLDNSLNRANVCPSSNIRVINMHDSFFNGIICGSTLLLFCPHTVGIECEEAENEVH
ncbi:hypothetical protein [Leptospira weilii]|uniref:hypothetical protein n=1 Tax=Leptospira weilii TaxID=28184 RepID=UPI001EF1A236|nr:hypothetical protein [Leptospira weilii]ULH30903.1 hypothetical protein FH586_22530 [Leptospira weilii]ULH30928.1 hypothetical protein FH586_21980 [Leptospira weilii]ULH30942.1 hypothetical protein FH586_22070 [Leptospira weilii]